jgi:multiple inositol-polyphosphate phosphatase / 2,3-bisphosphoglycerate 3-phosphatase
LIADTILYAYDICRFEKANNIKAVSPWCSLFTSDELKVIVIKILNKKRVIKKNFQLIEYAEDLKYYYNSGYGNGLNLKIGCPLLQDMMYRFRYAHTGIRVNVEILML